ncbi:hypothetical protein G6F23_015040 [Rhizopus arrhizus]|nr:hypothetical protein G6F23_015040 [Rhizopus arrhizus]
MASAWSCRPTRSARRTRSTTWPTWRAAPVVACRLPGLPGVHPQAEHRRVLPGLRQAAVHPCRRDLPDVRHAQRAHHRRGAQHRQRWRVRAPEAARHGRRPVRRSGTGRPPRPSLPRVCAGRFA